MCPLNTRLFLLVCVVLLAWSTPAPAQMASAPPPQGEYNKSVSFGISYGEQNDRNAEFWGWSIDYSRDLNDRWYAGVGLTWDRETDHPVNKPAKEVDTYTLVGTINYKLTSWMSLTTGIGRGIADNDNAGKNMKWKSGDWGTGIAAGFALPGFSSSGRDGTGFSIAYEYNLSEKETSISVDLSWAFSF